MTLLFPVLLDSSIRISVVALLVGLIMALTRVRSAPLRHTAWLAVLCAMPLMPILLSVAPPIRVPIALTSVAPEPVLLIEPPASFPEPSEPVASQAPVTVPHTSRPSVWPTALVFVYALVVLTLLWRLAAGWLAIQRVLRTSKRISIENVTVYESPMVSTPLTVGLVAQRILLPQDWTQWSKEKLHAVLAHESAHVERRDTVTSLLARVNRCVFWFHPLAWWLERQLAIAAEDACDDAGVRALGESRKYAEVLLDIADAVRRRGSRLSWQGAGVDGTGLLGQRIDRILRGGPFPTICAKQKVSVVLSCAVAIVVVAACRESSIYTGELKPDPEYTANVAKQTAAEEFSNAAGEMDARQVGDLEATLKKNPEDLDARKKLMIFYQAQARKNPEVIEAVVSKNPEDPGEQQQLTIYQSRARKTPGDDRALSTFRTHKLWFIQHHPENELSSLMNPQSDPAGDARARKLWLAVVERKDVSSAELSGAASFFERNGELQFAEKVFLRAQTLDPNEKWRRRLAVLYTSALAGPEPYAQEVRKKLQESTDSLLLSQTGTFLSRNRNPDLAALGKFYLERTLQLDPSSARARTTLEMLELDRNRQALGNFLSMPPNDRKAFEEQSRKFLPFSAAARFHFLPYFATNAYLNGARLEYFQHDLPGAKRDWELARRYAKDALRLAPQFEKDPQHDAVLYTSNMTLGMVAMRLDGDKKAARNYLLAASRTPARDADPFTLSLPSVLLRYGGPDERKAVIEYLERYGKIVRRPDLDLLKAAKQLRAGYMPAWYQYQARELK